MQYNEYILQLVQYTQQVMQYILQLVQYTQQVMQYIRTYLESSVIFDHSVSKLNPLATTYIN